MTYIIGALLVGYAVFVIVRKVKAVKQGKFCNCGSADCPSKAKCFKEK